MTQGYVIYEVLDDASFIDYFGPRPKRHQLDIGPLLSMTQFAYKTEVEAEEKVKELVRMKENKNKLFVILKTYGTS